MFVAFVDALPMDTFENEATNVTLSPEFPYELNKDKSMQFTSDCTWYLFSFSIAMHIISCNREARISP